MPFAILLCFPFQDHQLNDSQKPAWHAKYFHYHQLWKHVSVLPSHIFQLLLVKPEKKDTIYPRQFLHSDRVQSLFQKVCKKPEDIVWPAAFRQYKILKFPWPGMHKPLDVFY